MFINALDVTAITSSLVTFLRTAITVSPLLSNEVQRTKKLREQIDKFKQEMLWQKKNVAEGLRFCNFPFLIPEALMA